MAVDSISPVFSTQQSSAVQQLTSGSRINQAADDPAGQAVVTALTSQINERDIGIQNANDGIGIIQTAGGALQSIIDQVQRLSELSIQALNGTLTDTQRNILNSEFRQGIESIQQFSQTSSFNGINLLDGSTSQVTVALGADSEAAIDLPDLTPSNLGLAGLSIDNLTNATTAHDQLTAALEVLSTGQAQFGAQQKSLTSAINNMAEFNVNTLASRSQISDADMARAITEKTRQQVLSEANIAMLAQRNQQQENILPLLST